ncbi:hypothetical protein HD806DRAFT_542612 [Xylariaceae sp. AK1471]|nr:hypothetical protein HD806DRAFT_542612 [Xylariaceae sp. AK1471]
MFSRRNKKRGDDPVRLGLKMMAGAAGICGGFVFLVLIVSAVHSAIVKAGPSLPNTNANAVSHTDDYGDYDLYDLNRKQGPYSYGNNPLYPNVTSTSGTLTVTVTSTNVTTETVVPSMTIPNSTIETTYVPSTSVPITTSTGTLAVIPYGTFHGQTVTDSNNSTLVSSTMDAQGYSVTRQAVLHAIFVFIWKPISNSQYF